MNCTSRCGLLLHNKISPSNRETAKQVEAEIRRATDRAADTDSLFSRSFKKTKRLCFIELRRRSHALSLNGPERGKDVPSPKYRHPAVFSSCSSPFPACLSVVYFWGQTRKPSGFFSPLSTDLLDVIKPDDQTFTNIGGLVGYHANLILKKKNVIFQSRRHDYAASQAFPALPAPFETDHEI